MFLIFLMFFITFDVFSVFHNFLIVLIILRYRNIFHIFTLWWYLHGFDQFHILELTCHFQVLCKAGHFILLTRYCLSKAKARQDMPRFNPISKYSRNRPISLHLNIIRDDHVDVSIKAKRIDNRLTSSVLWRSILLWTFIVF